MFTHNTIVALLWLVVFASGGVIGSLIAWWRLSYRLDECCDCCTCQECEPDLIQPKLGRGYSYQFDENGIELPPHEWTAASLATGERSDGWHPGGPMQWGPGRDVYGNSYGAGDAASPSRRRTVVLEPGPTIYRALVPVDDESLYGPESRAKPSDSTFIRTVLMDWERRFPIPQDSPNGNM